MALSDNIQSILKPTCEAIYGDGEKSQKNKDVSQIQDLQNTIAHHKNIEADIGDIKLLAQTFGQAIYFTFDKYKCCIKQSTPKSVFVGGDATHSEDSHGLFLFTTDGDGNITNRGRYVTDTGVSFTRFDYTGSRTNITIDEFLKGSKPIDYEFGYDNPGGSLGGIRIIIFSGLVIIIPEVNGNVSDIYVESEDKFEQLLNK